MNSIITLISDYGSGSPYTASIIGSALKLMPEIKVVEISHQIPSYDIVQAAFLLRSVYFEFPIGTVHLICVDTDINLYKQMLIVEHEGHYFIGADNGVFSILFDEPPKSVLRILPNRVQTADLFPEKNLVLPVLKTFFENGNFQGLAEPAEILTLKTDIAAVEIENGIRGKVMFIDQYQNGITNIHRTFFESVFKDKAFKLFYLKKGRHNIGKISKNFQDGQQGDDLLLYNENGYLMIAISRGKGAQLLGLKPGNNILIEFDIEEAL